MSGSKVLYVSNCALSTIFVAYCEKGEVRGIVVKATAKKSFYSSLREVTTKFIPLEMGPFDYACPKKFLDMITPPTSTRKVLSELVLERLQVSRDLTKNSFNEKRLSK